MRARFLRGLHQLYDKECLACFHAIRVAVGRRRRAVAGRRVVAVPGPNGEPSRNVVLPPEQRFSGLFGGEFRLQLQPGADGSIVLEEMAPLGGSVSPLSSQSENDYAGLRPSPEASEEKLEAVVGESSFRQKLITALEAVIDFILL